MPWSAEDERLVEELAEIFYRPDDALSLAVDAGLPKPDIPAFDTARVFWRKVARARVDGVIDGGLVPLARAAARVYPENRIFASYRVARPVVPSVLLAPARDGASETLPRSLPRRFRWFTGRQDAIAAFGVLIDCAPADWHLLSIEGLTGTGKTFLVDYLHHSSVLPSAWITLGPDMDSTQILRHIAWELGGASLENAFAGHPMARRRRPPPEERIRKRDLAMDPGESDRFFDQIDTLVEVLEAHHIGRFALFIDDAEHLSDPWIRRRIAQQLVPQLRRSVPGFRAVLSGQTVPLEPNTAHQLRRIRLEPFSVEQSREMLAMMGTEDEAMVARVHARTRGLPLWLALVGKVEREHELDKLLEAGRDDWTRRVHDRLIARLSNESLRALAPDLSLLEFFDRDLLATISGQRIDRADFEELLHYQLIEPVTRGRWRCHALIRHELAARLWEEEPDHCRGVCERAFQAYRGRIETERARAGNERFDGRIGLVTACLRSAVKVSERLTREFFEDELLPAALERDGAYLLRLERVCAETTELSGSPMHRLVGSLERTVEMLQNRRHDLADPRPFEELADAFERRNERESAAVLLAWVALMADHPMAEVRALERATALDPEYEGWVLDLAEAWAEAGDPARAEHQLAGYRERNGETLELERTRADIAWHQGDRERARTILRGVLEQHPDAMATRLTLARRLDDAQAALELVESVLTAEPDREDAQRFRVLLLNRLGRSKEANELIGRGATLVARVLNESAESMHALDRPSRRIAMMEDIASCPEQVPFTIYNALGGQFAREGDLARVRELGEVCATHYPESRAAWKHLEAVTLMLLGREPEAIPMLEQLSRTTLQLFVPLNLALCYHHEGRLDDARATLEAWGAAQPGIRDQAIAHLVEHVEPDPSAGLARLDQEPEPGPHMRLSRAVLLRKLGRPAEAIETLEALIHSNALAGAPTSLGREARRGLIMLLNAAGQDARAHEQLERMVELYPDDAEAVDEAARLLAQKGDLAGVERLTSSWAEAGPIRAMQRLTYLASAILVRGAEPSQLVAAIRVEPDRAELILALRYALRQHADVEAEALSNVLAYAAATVFELEELTRESMRVQPPTERRRIVETWKRSDGSDLHRGCTTIMALAHDGRPDEAMKLADTLRDRFPESTFVLDDVELKALADADHLELALERLTPFLEPEGQTEPFKLIALSSVIERVVPTDDAVAFYERSALHVRDLRPFCLVRLAILHLTNQDHRRALNVWEELYAADPSVARTNMPARAQALLGLARTDEALEVIEEHLARVRVGSLAQAVSHCVRGNCLRTLERYPESEAAYRAALKLRPRHLDSLIGLAVCYDHQGRPADAYDTLMLACGESPVLRDQLSGELDRLRKEMRAPANEAS